MLFNYGNILPKEVSTSTDHLCWTILTGTIQHNPQQCCPMLVCGIAVVNTKVFFTADLKEVQLSVDEGTIITVLGFDAFWDDMLPRIGLHPQPGAIVPSDGRSWVTPSMAEEGLLSPSWVRTRVGTESRMIGVSVTKRRNISWWVAEWRILDCMSRSKLSAIISTLTNLHKTKAILNSNYVINKAVVDRRRNCWNSTSESSKEPIKQLWHYTKEWWVIDNRGSTHGTEHFIPTCWIQHSCGMWALNIIE